MAILAAYRLRDNPNVAGLLLLPDGFKMPEAADQPVRVRIELVSGLPSDRQHDLAEQAKLLKDQKITDYWKMHGPRETMRYVPRIIAAKEIYSQPEKYLGLSKKDLYLPLETETITVTVKKQQRALTSIAEEFGTYYLELKLLNPEFKKDFLPHSTYQIKVPRQTCPSRCFKQDKSP